MKIHAMCIYQITGLLAESKPSLMTTSVTSAQLYQSFFLKASNHSPGEKFSPLTPLAR